MVLPGDEVASGIGCSDRKQHARQSSACHAANSFFCHLFIGEVLFHEIGHHIHATYKPVHDGKENVAEDWSRRLALLHVKRRFWYLFPFIRFLAFVKKTKTRILRWSRRSVTVGGKL